MRAGPSKASASQQRDAVLRPKIRRVWDDNWKVYGVRKARRQLYREGEAAARCTVARLMAGMGLTANRLRGTLRGKAMKTTPPNTSASCPRDKVNRQFRAPAPNMLCPLIDTGYRLPGNRSATSPMSQPGRALFRSGPYAAPAPYTLRVRWQNCGCITWTQNDQQDLRLKPKHLFTLV